MARGNKLKAVIIAAAAVLIMLSGTAGFVSGVNRAETGFVRSGVGEAEYYTVTLPFAGWTENTFFNAPDFENSVFLGNNSYSYTLGTEADERYSVTASVTSPFLDYAAGAYTLFFETFTKQRASTPNILSVYTSGDGSDFIYAGEVSCKNDGSDIDKWTENTLTFDGEAKYLRFVFKVYYGATDGATLDGSGLYLNMDSIKLEKEETTDLSDVNFDVTLSGDLYYSGEAVYPTVSVTPDKTADFHYEISAKKDGVSAEPVDAGDYVLSVDIFNDANRLCKTVEKPFSVKKQTLALFSDTLISDGTYAVLLDAVFIDGAGRKIGMDEAGVERIYDGTKEVVLTATNADFENYSVNLGTVNAVNAGYVFYIDGTDATEVYDGGEHSVSERIKTFDSYDFETGEYHYVSAAVAVKYYNEDGTEADTVRDAGKYSYAINYGQTEFTGRLTVEPAEIACGAYTGSSSLDKIYDGTSAVCVAGIITDTLGENAVSLAANAGDDVKLSYKKVNYSDTQGLCYLIFEKAALVGGDKGNYVLSDDFYVSANAKITPAALVWKSATDAGGEELSFAEKVYDGTTAVAVSNASGTVLDMLGTGKGAVTYGDVAATLENPDAGTQKVGFTLSNASLYDIYSPKIIVRFNAQCVVKSYELTVETAAVSENEKVYDGTKNSELKIASAVFASYPDFGDGFGAASADEANYTIAAYTAEYDSAGAGEREITVSGAVLHGYTAGNNAVFSDYTIKTFTVGGKINPKAIGIETEYIRIYAGEALPDIEIAENLSGITAASIHNTREDAENGVNEVSNSRISAGEYFVRVTSASSNYALEGGAACAVIPLSVTAINVKASQKIKISNVDLTVTDAITMPTGGEFGLEAESVTEVGGVEKATGLKLTYGVSADNATVSEDGTVNALRAGSFVLTVSQSGNDNYTAAEDVSLNVEVADFTVSANKGSFAETLYGGDAVPDLSSYAVVKLNGVTSDGTVCASDGILQVGDYTYEYFFSPSEKYYAKTIDFSIKGTVYELSDGVYSVTSDTAYADGKTYYAVTGEQASITVGESVAEKTYYELSGGEYALTSDTVFAEGKTYFVISAAIDDTTVINGNYYVKNGDTYELCADERFSTAKTYYVIDRRFYGSLAAGITLSSVKKTLEITFGGTQTVSYGERAVFGDSVVSAALNGAAVDYEAYRSVISENLFALEFIAGGTKTDVTDELFNVGTFTVLSDETDGAYSVIPSQADGDYNIVCKGSFVFVVEKSAVTVGIGDLTKYYYADTPDASELLGSVVLSGSVAAADTGTVLSKISVKTAVTAFTSVGSYTLVPYGDAECGNYVLDYETGYITVKPVSVTVSAYSAGHVYGGEVAVITVGATVSDAEAFSAEKKAAVENAVANETSATSEADSASDAGSYRISMTYNGDASNFGIVFAESYYRVSAADFSQIYFYDSTVLYDGARHSIAVTYDKTLWPGVTVTYDKSYFVEKGVYEYTATVKKANYNDLELTATLIIGTTDLKGNTTEAGYVALKITDKNCVNGINPAYGLRFTSADADKTVAELVGGVTTLENYSVLKSYSVAVYDGETAVSLGYSGYTVTLAPADVDYSDKIKIYGYGEDGKFAELKYEYDDGNYTFSTSRLDGIVFVEETVKETSKTFIWVAAVMFALFILCVFIIAFSGRKKERRQKKISIRRHHRWV